ncbi:hypothetical protein J0895_12515 [Phormidium pseudopriestleyi FRX01]|uniref:Uncharacterized protein n=1 Tax=Phormidium pseudopriestleyi FRX01 TaxID=1759528 RepID=A0ABS3FS30_9CYAN|nr:hypothetical protein [Phormidium pseudopriestleyi]MBO0349921.1 hypothetical protein [Phormidium pseudopriestleyi FRX01]
MLPDLKGPSIPRFALSIPDARRIIGMSESTAIFPLLCNSLSHFPLFCTLSGSLSRVWQSEQPRANCSYSDNAALQPRPSFR